MYQSKNYASEIKPCTVEAKSITFNSANQAVVKFYNNNANDYAEATVSVSVDENRRLVSTDDSYEHEAFRRNANVGISNIAVICDNAATFVDNYSDNTTEEDKVDYTVTNNFSYSVPAIKTDNLNKVVGQSFTFNAGTAVVEGVNVVVRFSSREVSAIMHNGKDYRNNAPKCEVEVKTIRFISAEKAEITFVHENESVTAEVSVDVKAAETVQGRIVNMWVTDSYDEIRTYVSTDLHILVENNGSYTVYSRNVNSSNWTMTSLTAAEAQSVMSSGRAMAWAMPGAIGTVSYIQSSKSQTGYVITYYYANGSAAKIMGDAEAALNGKAFENPVKATGKESGDVWTINYNGSVYTFAGTIK